MKKHKGKIIVGLLILAVGLFIWNDSLYDKKPTLPLDAEQVRFMYMNYMEPVEVMDGYTPESVTLSDDDVKTVLDGIKEMNLVADVELQDWVAEKQTPWWGETKYIISVVLNTDFLQRCPAVDLYFFADGHVMMKCSTGYKPYPTVFDVDREYSYMRYYRAECENYEEALSVLQEIEEKIRPAEQGSMETFNYYYDKAANQTPDLSLGISNVKSVRTVTYTDSMDPTYQWDCTIYTVYPGATITVYDADMRVRSSDAGEEYYPQWGIEIGNGGDENIKLYDGMEPIEITENMHGVYHREGMIYVAKFEFAE